MLGSAIIKSLIGNLLEKLGSDLLGTWNLADNIEINSFSPLDIELRNLPIPQIIFEVADLPFIVIYSNVRLVKVSLKTDQMPSEENPLSIEGWDVDLQIRLASLDEWDSRKWCRRLLKSKRKKILRWYKYVSPWSTNKVADQISQSLETSIVNSLNIKLHNVHCVLIDDHLGPSPFAIDISSDSFFITSANDPGVLSEEELRGKESHLLQFLWIRFYGFRAVFRRSDHPLLASVPKNVVTKLVDIEGDATTALGVEEDEEEEEEGEEREGGGLGPDRHESSPPGRERSGFFSRLIGSLVQFFSPDKSEGQKINLLSSFLCSLNGQSSSQFEILRELSEIPVGSRDYSSAELPRHSQNGNSRFIRLPDDPSGCIQVTKDQGIEFHILFKRWDIRALNAPSCMFGSVFEDERQCREYISSREWKASKLIFLPSSDRYLKRPPSTETLADETFELTCTEDVVSVLYNFINYLSQWSAFLKASQYVYSNRKTHKELEEYLSSLVRCNGGSRRNGGPSSIPKQLLSEMETEISIRDVIALHMSADEFLKEGFSSKGGGFWRAFGRSPGVDAEALHRFVLERVLGGRTWEKFAEAKSVTRDKEVWIPDSKEIDCMKFSTFGRWFSSEGRLQVVIPKGRVSVVMSDLSSISSKASPVPDWMRSLLQERSPGEGVLGRMSGLIFEFDLNMLADKISFYHRQTSMKIFRLEILEGEFGLACGQLGRGRSRPESTGGHGSLMRTASHVMRAFPLTFLPGARVLEVGAGCCSRHGLEAGHGRDCGFEDCMDTFVGRVSRRASRLRLVDIDDNEVGVGEPGRDGERRPGVGLMLSIHQLFGRVILRDIKVPNDTVIPGFCPGFDYSIMDDEYLPHFNSNSVEISDLVLHDFKGIWRVASLVPNVTSNILSIISRSSRTSEAHLVRSLMEMISISAKDNALYSLSLQGVRVSSRYPNTTNTASRYSTRHLSLDKHLHDARSHPGCLACRLAPGGRRRWPGARTESPPELGLTTFRVGGQDLRSPDRCSAETLDKKVARIVSEILVSPDDFLQSLKTYRVMESSQSIFRGLTGLTLNSSFGNLASCEYEYKCEDEETGQVSESLLYNEILRYLLQNDYFIEENVSFTGIQIGLSSLCLQTRVGRGTLFLEMKGLSLCMLANQPEESARDPGRDGLGFSERQRKEEERRLEFLWMGGLSVQLSERQLDLSLSGVSVNVFPAIMTAINGYELLVFPKRSQVDLGRMFRNVSSFRVNKIETRGHRHSGSGGLRSLECLTVRLDEASVQIYDTEYLLYQLSLFDLRIRCMQSLAGRSRMTMSIALGEVFIQSINNIILGDQNLGYQRIRSDFSGRHFFTPSVVFSKLSGHLVPSQKMHTKSGDISHFPYVLVHSDQFQTSSKTGTESDMLEEDPILSLEVRVRAREGGADESQSSLEEGAPETTKYVISVISKVRNGNFFFTDDDMIRLKSIFSLYRRISSQFRRERNSLWSSDFVLERESPLEAYRLSRQGAGGEAEAERPPLESSDFCGDCGGLSIDLMGEVKNRDEYFVEVSLSFENFYVHFLVNSDKLYKNRLIDNQLLEIHREAVEFSSESLTLVRPLFCFNSRMYDSSRYNPRTAVLTAESVGLRLNFCIQTSVSSKCLGDGREWRIKTGFREMSVMVVRNGTWGMLDFSLKKMTLKVVVHLRDILEYKGNQQDEDVLQRFLGCLRLVLRKEATRVFMVKFKIRDICIWSILYERIKGSHSSKKSGGSVNTTTSTVDMFLTKTSSSLEYVCLSPLKSSLSEYSSSLLPEYITVDRRRRHLSRDEMGDELFPSWEYGLSLPLAVPFNHPDLLLNSRPKLFPVFGKRPMESGGPGVSVGLESRHKRCLRGGREVFIIPMITLKSNEVSLGGPAASSISIDITISPTFLSVVPLVFRQLIDVSFMYDKFKTVHLDEALLAGKGGLSHKRFRMAQDQSLPGREGLLFGVHHVQDSEPRHGDTITSILRSLGSVPVASFEVKSKFNTMVVIFPEFNDLEMSDSVSSRYFEVYSRRISQTAGQHAGPDSVSTGGEQPGRGWGAPGPSRSDDYYISVFSNSSHPAVAFSHNISFLFALETDKEGGGGPPDHESLRISLEISQLRVQLPFVRNIGGGYSIDGAATRGVPRTGPEDAPESRDPILDIFIPSVNSCFVLSTSSHPEGEGGCHAAPETRGVLFGMVSIPIVFAIDGARIPVMDDTFILRSYALRRSGGEDSTRDFSRDLARLQDEISQEEGLELSREEDPCFARCMMSRPELLGVIINAVGDHYLQIQANLNNFRFIFSLTTFSVSAPYIQRINSWWNDIWLIRMRYPRCPGSTMRYFYVDTRSDTMNISSFGVASRSTRLDYVADGLEEVPRQEQHSSKRDAGGPMFRWDGVEGANEVYCVNRFDYANFEVTSPLFFPLDDSIPIVLALPVTASLDERVRPWNSLEFRPEDGFVLRFSQSLKDFNLEILQEERRSGSGPGKPGPASENHQGTGDLAREGGACPGSRATVKPDPFLVCSCREPGRPARLDSSLSESNMLNGELAEFGPDEETPARLDHRLSVNAEQVSDQRGVCVVGGQGTGGEDLSVIHEGSLDYFALANHAQRISRSQKKVSGLLSGWISLRQKLSSNSSSVGQAPRDEDPRWGAQEAVSSEESLQTGPEGGPRRRSFSLFKRRSSNEGGGGLHLSPIHEGGPGNRTSESEQKTRRESRHVAGGSTEEERIFKFQVSLNNLEIWFHRDNVKENMSVVSRENLTKDEIDQLTLEEVAVDWMSKAVHCVPASRSTRERGRDRDTFRIRIQDPHGEDSGPRLGDFEDEDEDEDGEEELEFVGCEVDLQEADLDGGGRAGRHIRAKGGRGARRFDSRGGGIKGLRTEEGGGCGRLFANSYEIFAFRRNISTYDQADYDYITKSSRYGKRQELAVHRSLRPASSSYFLPSSEGGRREDGGAEESPEVGVGRGGVSYRVKREDAGLREARGSGGRESQFLNGTAFSILLSFEVSAEMTNETFQIAGECSETRILPGFPVRIREEALAQFGVLPISQQGESCCTCNYCRITSLRRYLYLHTLNGRNIYLSLTKAVPDRIKRDFLLLISHLKIFSTPSGVRKSSISKYWTGYHIETEFVISEVTISVSMDILQEIKLFISNFKEVRDSIAYYSLVYSRSRKSYIVPEAILNPFSPSETTPPAQIQTQAQAHAQTRRSFLSQVLPTIMCLSRLGSGQGSGRIRDEGVGVRQESRDASSDELSEGSSLGSSESSRSSSSMQESQVILLYYLGFPLPHSNAHYIPESVRRHLRQEMLQNLGKNRRFGIYTSNDSVVCSSPKETDRYGEYLDPALHGRRDSGEERQHQKVVITENTIYSVISSLIRYSSLPLEWVFRGLKSSSYESISNLFKKYRFLSLLKLPKSHLDKHRQLTFEYRLSSFNIVIHNDNIDILRLSIDSTKCQVRFPEDVSCRLTGVVSAITHDPIMDCMITIIRPFPYTLEMRLVRQGGGPRPRLASVSVSVSPPASEVEVEVEQEQELGLNCLYSSSRPGADAWPILEVDFCTESISLELTSGFLQNLRLILSDFKNSHLLGLIFAYERKISSVRVINDIGQSFLIVQPVSVHAFRGPEGEAGPERPGKRGARGGSEEEARGLRSFLLESGDYCSVPIKLPVYMAVEKFTHRKGQKTAARIQANRNSDRNRDVSGSKGQHHHKTGRRDHQCLGGQDQDLNGFLNITAQTVGGRCVDGGRRVKEVHVIDVEGVGEHKGQERMGNRQLKNSPGLILSDILGELCTLGVPKRRRRAAGKHLWLEEKKSELLYGSTGLAEQELRQLAEQLELATPALDMASEGVEMMIHRFIIAQSTWSSIGKLKDDTLYRRAYRLGILGFLLVLEPESGTLPNEWIWTLGTCVQIENATNIVFRVTANWRHGIRHFCGALFTEPSRRSSGGRGGGPSGGPTDRSQDADCGRRGNEASSGGCFPYMDVPPYSRRSIPLSWFLLGDMEPSIVPILSHNDTEEDCYDDEADRYGGLGGAFEQDEGTENRPPIQRGGGGRQSSGRRSREGGERETAPSPSGQSNRNEIPSEGEEERIRVDERSVRRIQSRLHSVPFTILKMLIHEIMTTQPGNVAKAKLANEVSSLTFESLMAFSCQVECVDIPTSEKYVTSYAYSIKLTPLLKLTNSLPFPIQIRLKMAGGLSLPTLAGGEPAESEADSPDLGEGGTGSRTGLETRSRVPASASGADSGVLGELGRGLHSKEWRRRSRAQRVGDSNYSRLGRVYRREFGALVQFLSGRSVDYIIQSQQELELPICRQKISLVVYVNGSPLEYCSYPLFTNTQQSTDYVQSRNAQMSEFIYRSESISVSFPFGSTISQNISLRRVSGNPFNAWNPFYSQLLQGFFGSIGESGREKLADAISNFTISVSTSAKRILFSALSRVENTTDSIICLFYNDSGSPGGSHQLKQVHDKRRGRRKEGTETRLHDLEEGERGEDPERNEVRALLSTGFKIVPLPPMYRFFTSIENLKSMRVGSFTLDFLTRSLRITTRVRKGSVSGWSDFSRMVSSSLVINHISKISSKYDFSSLGASYSIKLPLTPILETRSQDQGDEERPTVSIGAITHNNDLLSQLNCPLVSFYNKYEFVSQLPFPIVIHKFTNSREMHQTIRRSHSNPVDLDSDMRDASIILFRNSKDQDEDDENHGDGHAEDGAPLVGRSDGLGSRPGGDKESPEFGPLKTGRKYHRFSSRDLKLPPRTSLSCDGVLLRPNERRPYHGNDPNVWICKPLIEGSSEPLQASKEFSLFSGQRMEYTPQLNKFQIVLHPQHAYPAHHRHDHHSSAGVSPAASSGGGQSLPSAGNPRSVYQGLSNSASGASMQMTAPSSLSESENKDPLLITIQIIPAILGTAASGSTSLRDSAYFVIFSVAEAPFFEICNLSSYYIAYDTPEISKPHNYYYRSKKAVMDAVSVGTSQLEDLSRTVTSMNGDKGGSVSGGQNPPRSKKKTYINHLHATGYVYPDIFSAKSADISVIPPKTRIPYIPKNWDCELIGIRPFNVSKSVWTTHSVTSIKDQISVISFVKLSDKASHASSNPINTKHLSGGPPSQVQDSRPSSRFQNPFTDTSAVSNNGLSSIQSKPRTGRLYVFLMVNSKGTRVLTILDNRKYAEKLLNGSVQSISSGSPWGADLESLLSLGPDRLGSLRGEARGPAERRIRLPGLSPRGNGGMGDLGSEDGMDDGLNPRRKYQRTNHLSARASQGRVDGSRETGGERSGGGEQVGSSPDAEDHHKLGSGSMRKISWIGFRISFFIPRTSISWIHQNELVLVTHGSLFHVSASILPQNIRLMSVLNVACDSLMNLCYKLVGFSESREYRRNPGTASNVERLRLISHGHLRNSRTPIAGTKKSIMALFTHRVNHLFSGQSRRRQIFGRTIQIDDESDSQLQQEAGAGAGTGTGADHGRMEHLRRRGLRLKRRLRNRQSNGESHEPGSCYESDPEEEDIPTAGQSAGRHVASLQSISYHSQNKAASGANDSLDGRTFELLSEAVKDIYQFLSRELNSVGGSASPKENPDLSRVLKLLRKVYRDCVSCEKYVKRRMMSVGSEIQELAGDDDDPGNIYGGDSADWSAKYYRIYDGVLASLIQIVILISSFMERTLLTSGRIILNLGLSSIHIDHFLPGDIPVILKTSGSNQVSDRSENPRQLRDLDQVAEMESLESERPGSRLGRGGLGRGSRAVVGNSVRFRDEEVGLGVSPGGSAAGTESLGSARDLDNRFLSLTVSRSLMSPIYAPIFDEINITVSQICCNLERLVVQTLYFMVSKEIENMNIITYSRQKTLWMHSTRQKMIEKKSHREMNYLGSLVCYVSGGYGLPMYITRTPWDQLKIGKPLYIRTLEISDIIVTITIRTSDDTIDIDTLTPEALLFMNILPLDTPHMILNVSSLRKDALVVDIAEFLHFLVSSYSRQLKRRVLPSLGLTHLVAIYSGMKRGLKALFVEIKRGLTDDDLTFLEGFIQGFRVGLIHFFRYFLGGMFQTASVIFNFGHKLLGGRRPRPKSILDAIWNGIVGMFMDTFITPWVLLCRDPMENFRKTNKKRVFVLTVIFSIVRIALSCLFGALNLLASITESLATTLIGDFEQFVHVKSRAELMNEIEKDRILSQKSDKRYTDNTDDPDYSEFEPDRE